MKRIELRIRYKDSNDLVYTLNQLDMLGYKWRNGERAIDLEMAFPLESTSIRRGTTGLNIFAVTTETGDKILTGETFPIAPLNSLGIFKILPVRNSKIEKVIFNNPATIVFWKNGTKTVVKAHGEKYDPEKGLAMAIAKKYFGNECNYFNNLRPWLEQEKEKAQNAFEEWIRKELCKEE